MPRKPMKPGRRKTPEKRQQAESARSTALVKPPLIPQPHGGALYAGGTVGNRGNRTGNSGYPPSRVRAALRASFEERAKILEEIADGEVTVRLRLRGTCPECGHQAPEETPEVQQLAKAIAEGIKAAPRFKERLDAIDLMGKYGLGPVQAVSDDEIRDRLRRTIEIIEREVRPREEAERILHLMERVWL